MVLVMIVIESGSKMDKEEERPKASKCPKVHGHRARAPPKMSRH